ncbi:MAG: type II secretion system protein [Candidatus Hydrogenedentota bacterium]
MMNLRRGFTLIELMVVCLIIGIIVAIAVPLLLRNRMGANEAGAIAALRTISSAEIGYKASAIKDEDNDGEGEFATLEELGNPTEGSAPFIDSSLASGIKEGYRFTVTLVPPSGNLPPGYGARGVPLVDSKTGVRKFYINDSNVIRFTADGTEPGPESTPLN